MQDDGRQFVDTNILVYAYDRSETGKRNRARELLSTLWESRQGCLSIQVLQEFYVTLTAKVPHVLPPETAGRIVADLGTWHLHVPDLSSLRDAFDIQVRNRVSFRDAMIICSAKQLGCKLIWTEDLNPGQDYEGVKAVNPFAG
jgi:predicted nucleic acid-binding protein